MWEIKLGVIDPGVMPAALGGGVREGLPSVDDRRLIPGRILLFRFCLYLTQGLIFIRYPRV